MPARSRAVVSIAPALAAAALLIASAGIACASTSQALNVSGTLAAETCSGMSCMAVGWGSGQGLIVPVSAAGVFGTAQAVPGTADLYAAACPSPNTCIAAGDNSSNDGTVVSISNGIPSSAQVVAGTSSLTGVACYGPDSCVAVGTNYGLAVVVPITNGTAGSPLPVSGAVSLHGVACPNSTCVAVGWGSTQGVLAQITDGTPGSAQIVPATSLLFGVACATASSCEAVGRNNALGLGVAVPITSGSAGTAQPVSGTQRLDAVACPSATVCEASGPNASLVPQPTVVPIFNGVPVPAATKPVPFYAVACPSPFLCQSTGIVQTSTGAEGVVMSFAPQTVISLTFDNAAISQYTLGYQQALAPANVKATFYINSGVLGGANHMSWSQLSTLASAGEEIGGKTVDATNLTTLTTAQQISEICNDRQALVSHGLKPAGFAYPGGAFNTTIESAVQSCGYNNARSAGSLSAAGPGYAESLPPKNWLALRAYAPTGQVTVNSLQSLVNGAASHGNGWIPIVIQKVCSQTVDPSNYASCTLASGWIELADLKMFLSWVNNSGQAGGAPAGTLFSPIAASASSIGQPPL